MSTRALELGTLIHARYRVERVLGEGGFGVTYQVSDLKENRIAAMKEYMPADIAYRRAYSNEVHPKPEYKEAYQKFRDKFLEEARIIYRFRGHPNIIDVNHLFYDNNTAYYVMEYINGQDLDRYLKERGGRLSWQELHPIMGQVAAALQEVHRSNMIHCDISPDNIFLLDRGQVKLIDFGAAKSVLHGQSSMILLKRGFAPPEQLYSDGKLGPWTDVYAMAVTLYRAYTGKMPPTAEDRLVSDQTVWPSQMGIPAPTPYWEAALRKAMSLRWEDRYQDVNVFWQALTSGAAQKPRQKTWGKLTDLWKPGYTQPVQQPNQPVQYQPQQMQPHQYQPQQIRPQQYQPQQMQPQQYQPNPYPAQPSIQPLMLEGLQGVFAGMRFPVKDTLILGTDWSRCNVQFPPQSPGISRVHVKLWPENGTAYAMDAGSTYGTWLDNKKMTPGLVYPLPPGATIYLGDGQYFRLLG